MSTGGLGMDDSMEETTGAVPLRQPKGEFSDKSDKALYFFLYFS